jgi:hypothetical protein
MGPAIELSALACPCCLWATADLDDYSSQSPVGKILRVPCSPRARLANAYANRDNNGQYSQAGPIIRDRRVRLEKNKKQKNKKKKQKKNKKKTDLPRVSSGVRKTCAQEVQGRLLRSTRVSVAPRPQPVDLDPSS